jgi:hypothetical protein
LTFVAYNEVVEGGLVFYLLEKLDSWLLAGVKNLESLHIVFAKQEADGKTIFSFLQLFA